MSRARQIQKVTILGLVINLLLSIGKILAGVVGSSSAMVADGVHSVSDMVTDIVVILFIGISGKERDWNHQYGHGKFETFASFVISIVLFFIGLGISLNSFYLIIDSTRGIALGEPGIIAFYAAILSLLVKEGLFWYTKIHAEKWKSNLLLANAWHHRSDSLSSIATVIGIGGAIYGGEKFHILDPITGIIVCFFIWKVSWDIGKSSVDELLETALPESTQTEIREIIASYPKISSFRHLKTRKIGDSYGIDVHIFVDGNLTVTQGHDIADQLEIHLREKFGHKSHIGIHVEPDKFFRKNLSDEN